MAKQSESILKRAREVVKVNESESQKLFGEGMGVFPEHPSVVEVRKTLRTEFNVFHPKKRPRSDAPRDTNGAHGSVRDDVGESSKALVVSESNQQQNNALTATRGTDRVLQMVKRREQALENEKPTWHPPWRSYRVISGHLGWVRCVAFDASNAWFATGSADRTVKIWDSATGRLKLTLTGHVSTVRGIAISERHPYMFTVGEDKMVKCWDLEQNKVIRNYHGHLSGVYCVSLHPVLDVLVTGGRDSTVRVWDVRTRAQVFVLGAHRDTVNSVLTQPVDPQIISASVDSTIRTWDLAAGRCSATLTNHKKGVRALAAHPREFSFASASAENIKTWALPNGTFMRNLSGAHGKKLVNALAINEDGVLASGGDDGTVAFWDYSSAHCFQKAKGVVQPGSLECENGIYGLAFDKSGSRLVTCETDKTVRMWREIDEATEETHPLVWEPKKRDRY
ncbi:WD40/YVTN repeat-like containing protein [Gracilaria domingensis]|nr:WD40/YVTN repeat-like containing protein [Gracilaria domingensis]